MVKGQQVKVWAAWINRYVDATVLRSFPLDSPSKDYVQVRFAANHDVQMIPVRIVKVS